MVVYNIKLSKHGAFRWHTSNVSGSQLSYTPIFTFLSATGLPNERYFSKYFSSCQQKNEIFLSIFSQW